MEQFDLAPHVTLTVAADEGLLMNLADETMFTLNLTGTRIAELITAGHSLQATTDILADGYDVARVEIEREVVQLVHDLEAAGLIVRRVVQAHQ